MKNKLHLHYFVLLFLLISNASAQIGLSVHAGPSLILNDFDSKYYVSAKEVGLNLGVKYKKAITAKMDVIGNIDYLFNNYDVKNKLVKRLSFNQFPVTAGFSLHSQFMDEGDIFITGLLGCNFAIIPKFEYLTIYKDIIFSPMRLDKSLCYKIQCGLQISDTYFLTFNYLFDYNDPLHVFYYGTSINKKNISMTLGYGF